MSLDQSFNSSLTESSFQPFDSLPDEVLLLLLDQLTPFQRCLILSICKKWNFTILQRKSWWQYLDIPDHLSFSTALSILQTFNSRSNFTLKHVIIQPRLKSLEELVEVFAELKKCSGHVKLLFLNHSTTDYMPTARRAAKKFLPKLNTFYSTYSSNVKQDLKLMWYERDLAGILDEKEKGLRFLQVPWLEQLEPDDLEWLSKLTCLSVWVTDSVKDLRSILEVSKMTLGRLRLNFWRSRRNLEGPDLHHADGLKKIKLPNLTAIFTPINKASAAALSTIIDVGRQQTLFLNGFVHPLLHFDFPSLKNIRIRVYSSNDLEKLKLNQEESKLKIILFFEGNPSISYLQLDCVAGLQEGESFHLNFILQSLSIRKPNEAAAETEEEHGNLPLPKLRQLTIGEPKTFNKKLLKQFWETRKAIYKDFSIQVRVEGRISNIDRSEGEEWLDEAESCERS